MRELMWAAVAAIVIAVVLGYSVVQSRPDANPGGGSAQSTNGVAAQLARNE